MENELDWIYSFQAISGNFGSSWQESLPSPGAKQGTFLYWIYSFQGISGNFGFSWQLSFSPLEQNRDFLD